MENNGLLPESELWHNRGQSACLHCNLIVTICLAFLTDRRVD